MDNKQGLGADFLGWLLSDPGRIAMAGALGGLVRWITLKERWQDGVLSIVVGAICATYLGPLAIPILEPIIGKVAPGGDANGFSAFVIGIGGMAVSGFLIGVWSDWRKRGSQKES